MMLDGDGDDTGYDFNFMMTLFDDDGYSVMAMSTKISVM